MSHKSIIGLSALLSLIALLTFLRMDSSDEMDEVAKESGRSELNTDHGIGSDPSDIYSVAYANRMLEETVALLQSDKSAAAEQLELLRDLFFELPEVQASQLIEAALRRDGLDAATGLHFTVEAKGRLQTASSVRVALLDWWGQVDPLAAAQFAEEIFSECSNPDEYAISLRNYAWAYPRASSHDYLSARALDLATNRDWMAQPTAGTLEAFDVFVYARATEATSALVDLVAETAPSDQASAYAAFLTLDRLYQQQPKALFAALENSGGLDAGRGVMIAQVVARSDMRQPEERRNVERYFLAPARTASELEAFAGIFPNHNYMVSDNLLTEVEIPDGRELQARDLAAYDWVSEKIHDPRFIERKNQLQSIQQRLEQFLYPAE